MKNLMDVFAREFLFYCANYHFLLFDPKDRQDVCDRLQISQEELNALVSYCLNKNYADVFDFKYHYINPTLSGFAALGLDEDGGKAGS